MTTQNSTHVVLGASGAAGSAILGALAQIPAGRLSDKMDRRLVIVFLSGGAACIGLLTVLISTAGLLFVTETVLFEGDAINCSFELKDSGRINLSAEIVRTVEAQESPSLKKRYGVRFTDIGDQDASAIEAFINAKAGPHLLHY